MDVQSEKKATFIGFQSQDDVYPPFDSDGYTSMHAFQKEGEKNFHEITIQLHEHQPKKDFIRKLGS